MRVPSRLLCGVTRERVGVEVGVLRASRVSCVQLHFQIPNVGLGIVVVVVGVDVGVNPSKFTRPLIAELGRSTAKYFVLSLVISGWVMIIPCQFFIRLASKSSI